MKKEKNFFIVHAVYPRKRFPLPPEKQSMQAMVLAAGFGTRLRPYSELRPKPLFPVLGRPLLARILDRLRAEGFDRVVVNAHHLAGQIVELVAGSPDVILQHEEEILGTGGGLRRALAHLRDEPLLVVNGDIVHDVDLASLRQFHRAAGGQVTLALHDVVRYSKVTCRQGRVLSLGAGEIEPGMERLAFTGVQVVEPQVLERIPPGRFFHIIDLYEELARAGQVRAMRVDGCYWRDMGTPRDYLALHGELLTGPARPWPETAAQRAACPLCLASDAHIGSGLVWRDWLAVGRGAVVGEGAELVRCVVWDGARVAAGARLYDTIVPA